MKKLNKKVLYVGYGIDSGRKEAVSTNVFKRIKLLKKLGYEADYVSIGYQPFKKEGYYFGNSMVNALINRKKVIKNLKRYIKNNNFSHVHDVFVLPFASYYFVRPLIEKDNDTVYIKEYFNDSGFSKNIHTETFIRIFANNSVFINGIQSKYNSLVTENFYLSKKLNAVHIPSIVDINKLSRKERKTKLRVCFLGHPLKKKGIYAYPELFSILPDNLKDWVTFDFALSSVGPKNDVEEKIKKVAVMEGIKINFSGQVNPGEYFREQDIFILPIQDEYGAISTPNSILEAMEAGCVVVVTDIKTLEGIIEDKRTGYLLRFPNSNEMLETIKYIINNDFEVDNVAKAARVKILEDHSDEILIRSYQKLYE